MRIAALLAAALSIAFLAGCTDGPPAGGPGPTGAPSSVAGSPLVFSDCRQFHTYFPARAADFESQVPTGFTLVADEAGVSNLRVEATACAIGPGGLPASMLWITLPVVPPRELADANASHALAIEAYVDSDATRQWLQAAGAGLAEPCVCSLADAPSPVLADSFVVDGEADDYTLQTALAPADGPFDAFHAWTYVAADGRAVARILADNQGSVSRGLGSAVLAYTGPGGAPPLAAAEVAHVVDGLAFTWAGGSLEVA